MKYSLKYHLGLQVESREAIDLSIRMYTLDGIANIDGLPNTEEGVPLG